MMLNANNCPIILSNDWVTRGDALAVMWHFFIGHTVIPPNTYYHFASTWSHFSHKTGSTSSQVLHVFSELLWLRNDGIFHNFRRAVHCCSSDVNVCRFDLQLINFLSFYMPPVCCTSFVDIFHFFETRATVLRAHSKRPHKFSLGICKVQWAARVRVRGQHDQSMGSCNLEMRAYPSRAHSCAGPRECPGGRNLAFMRTGTT